MIANVVPRFSAVITAGLKWRAAQRMRLWMSIGCIVAVPALAAETVFVSNRDGHMQIYAMAPDSGNERALTHGPGGSNQPAWSPDGKRIAFTSTRDGDAEIYVMNVDGSGQKRLTANPSFDAHPVWSPDGRQIAFLSSRDGAINIYAMNNDGTNARAVTRLGADQRVGVPVWSTDGSRMFFTAAVGGKFQIFSVKPDGSELQDVSSRISPGAKSELSLSPDGRWLAFAEEERAPVKNIHVMRTDGSEVRKLTNSTAENYSPRWSPDGRHIAFVTNRDDRVRSEVYVMDADGRNPRNLSRHPMDDFEPRWMDNQTIVYVSLRDRYAQLYQVAIADAAESFRMTHSPSFELEPTPSPSIPIAKSGGADISNAMLISHVADIAAK
jgi:TolB protein